MGLDVALVEPIDLGLRRVELHDVPDRQKRASLSNFSSQLSTTIVTSRCNPSRAFAATSLPEHVPVKMEGSI
jgi:hypothetical protein